MASKNQTITPAISRRDFIAGSLGLISARAAIESARAQPPGIPAAGPAGPIMAYVGTFTRGTKFAEPYSSDPGNGLGIHQFRMDPDTGFLTPHEIYSSDSSPNCLALNRAQTHLYATNKGSGTPGTDSGTVSAFAIDRSTGHLTLLNSVSSGGAGPAHLSLHPSGRFVLVANYVAGTVAVLPLQAGGALGRATDIKALHGQVGPTRASGAPPGSFANSGHDGSHAHMILADPSGNFVLAANLGLDRILVWKFDQERGRLAPNDPDSAVLPPGDGPRHFAFHPGGRWLYSLQEEGSTLVLFDYEGATGRLSARQSLSSLPPGFAGTSFASEIMVSTDGRFVYAANRLHDCIGCFAVAADGTLAFVGEEWTRGDYPRSFAFDPSGNFLYSCNQRSDAVTTFRVNRQSGGLAFAGQYTPVGSPSAMVFAALDLSA